MRLFPKTVKPLAVLAAILWGLAGSAGAEPDFPFQVGETLHFELRWTFIKAGEASLKVLPMAEINGKKAWHFVMTARTTPFLDTFYKVRDRIDSYVALDMSRTLRYEKKQLEGKTHRDIVVKFDWDNQKAQYFNFSKPKDPIDLKANTLDPLSAFYYVRTQAMGEKKVLQRPVTDGKKNVIGRATVRKKETLTIGEQAFETFLIEPELKHIGGVFEKSEDARIQLWLSADPRRIPMRIRSKVIVGSFIGELMAARGTITGKNKDDSTDRRDSGQ